MKHSTTHAIIALGSNLNNPHAQLKTAKQHISTLGRINAHSSLYRTTPVGGPAGQDDYLNAVLMLAPFEAFRDPTALLEALLSIELKQGRERRERWAARTLDLDVLAFGQQIMHTPALILPHPRMMERAFVLAPLCEIAPDWQHPQHKQTPCEALASLKPQGVTKTNLRW